MKQKTEGRRREAEGRIQKLKIISYLLFIITLFTFHLSLSNVHADENTLNKMRDEVISYFNPITGKITAVDGKKVLIDIGIKDSVKNGMRFTVLREEAPFRHPVTKEPLGRMESATGKLEIKEVNQASSSGEIIEGAAKEGDKVRISEIKVNMLFCQSKNVDWYMSETYYRNLKDSGRFNLLDTGIETDDPSKVMEEAKKLKADVVLILASRASDSGTFLTQKLFWVSDGQKFSELDAKINIEAAKDLNIGEKYFSPHKEDAWLETDLTVDAKLITMADIDGDGKQEIILSTGKDIVAYAQGTDLQQAVAGFKITGSAADDHIWLDAIDLNKNGRDEIIITSMRDKTIVSYIYEMKGNEPVLLYKADVFLRKIDNRLIAQEYSRNEGFDGDVFSIVYDGEYKRGGKVNLPKGVNIYDFVYLDDPRSGRILLSYDEKGYLNLYDANNSKIWRSKTSTGGFLTTFQRSSPTVAIDRGEWAVKGRLFYTHQEILFVKRTHLLEMVKGLGYKNSQIMTLQWNGLSMEEGVLIDDIKGSVLDYTISGNKIIVIKSPLFGIKPENILKGENPIRTILSVYSMKGR